MNKDPPGDQTAADRAFAVLISAQAQRKLKARRNPGQGIGFGLGMMGLIGWSIVVPTLLGAGLGRWLDQHHGGAHSWTLPLLVAGLVLGCINAWRWVDSQDQAMHQQDANDHE